MKGSAAATGAAGGNGFRRDIQGLRAVAVLLVILYHVGVPGITGGFIGVDVFFVISGFLITGHLCSGMERTGTVGLFSFYARRLRRLLPAALLVAVGTAVAALLVLPPVRYPAILRDAAATVLYVPNIHFHRQQLDYLADTEPTPFKHYWSLGVEEQFYLVWPLLLGLIFLLARRSARPIRWVGAGLAMTTAASLVAACLVVIDDPTAAFYATPLRAWEFGVGGLVALLARSGLLRRAGRGALAVGSYLGIGGVLVIALDHNADTVFPGIGAIAPVFATALLIACGCVVSSPVQAVLGSRVMVHLGALSYVIYLLHWPVLILVQAGVGSRNPLPLWAELALMLGVIAVAEVIHRWVEEPARHWKTLTLRPAWVTLVAAVLAAVALVGAFAATDRATATIDLDAGLSAPDITGPVFGPPDPAVLLAGTGYVPSTLRPPLRGAGADLPVLYDNGCHLIGRAAEVQDCHIGDNGPQVALFGDSHAAQWHPALVDLAEAGALQVSSYTKSDCTFADVDSYVNGRLDPSCRAWRDAVLAHLQTDPPELVVLAGRLPVAKEGGPELGQAMDEWVAGIGATVSRLTAVTRVLVITDNPGLPEAPATCLAGNLDHAHACDVPATVLDQVNLVRGAQAAVGAGATVLDVNDRICGPEICPAIIGDVLVNRDPHHLTATFVRTLVPELRRAVDAALDR